MCEHEHLRTVGHRLFCKDCGEELPIEFLTAGKAVKQAAEGDEQPKVSKSRGRKNTGVESK